MAFNVDEYKTQSVAFNSEFELEMNKLKQTFPNLKIDTDGNNKFSENLDKIIKKQKDTMQNYEGDNVEARKRFRVLKRYGEVLEKVKKLLGIIPSDLENLSTEELYEKLEELLKTKKHNNLQMIFNFFQNLYTESINNLLSIEKDFQEGNLSSDDALKNVQKVKSEVLEQEDQNPKILDNTKKEVTNLIEDYENFYKIEKKQTEASAETFIEPYDMSDEHKILIENINKKAQSTLSEVKNLSADLSSFEPQVDLAPLAKNLENTEACLDSDIWNPDDLDSEITKLENTTNILTAEQTDKNEQRTELSERITQLSTTTTEDIKTSTHDVSKETFTEASKRANNTKETAQEINELVDEDKISTSIGAQYAETIIEQMETDHEFCTTVAQNPNAAVEYKELEDIDNALTEADILKDKSLSFEEKQVLIKQLDLERDDDENNNK